MRILLIDDEKDIRASTAALLEHLGHEVRTAKNGLEAVECAAAWPPDVVITDLSMPVMDGFLAARKLRAAAQDRPMLIVAYSAHLGDKMARDLATAAGCTELLLKPMDWPRLRRILHEFKRTLDSGAARSES